VTALWAAPVATCGSEVGDPEAWLALLHALGAGQKWPEGVRGFSAAVTCRHDDRVAAGRVCVDASGGVAADLPESELARWVSAELGAVALAMRPVFFGAAEGRYAVRFDEPRHGEGRRVVVAAPDAIVYCLDARGRIAEERRGADGVERVRAVERYVRAAPGRVLPAEWWRGVRDAVDGRWRERACYEDAWACVDHVWLPTRRPVCVTRGDQEQCWTLSLSEHAVS
jgi:hypothetical protein